MTVFFAGPGSASFDADLQVTQAPVPEPSSLVVLASGLVGPLGFLLRRRRMA